VKTPPTLWDYACTLYKDPSAQSACMALQDDFGLNTPLLLFGCWQLKVFGFIDPQVLHKAQGLVTPVDRTVVTPLREIRRAMKKQGSFGEPQWQAIYKEIAATELKAEALLLEQLEHIAQAKREREPAAGRLLSLEDLARELYFSIHTQPADQQTIKQHLAALQKANIDD